VKSSYAETSVHSVSPSEAAGSDVGWPGLSSGTQQCHKKTGVGSNKRHTFLHEQSITLRLGIIVISRSLVEKKGWDPKTASQPQQLQERGCVNDISCHQKANSPRDVVVGAPGEEEALAGTKIPPTAERIK